MKRQLTVILLVASLLMGVMVLTVAAATVEPRIYWENEPIAGWPDGPLVSSRTDLNEIAGLILAAAEMREPNVDLSSFRLSEEEYRNIAEEVLYTQHPEMIWVKSYGWSEYDGSVREGLFMYDPTVTEERIADYEKQIAWILSGVDPQLSDLEKLLVLHDLFALRAYYDDDFKQCEAHDIVCDGIGVCRGYTKAYNDCLKRLGFTVRYTANWNHCWTLVKLDGNWYNIDVTWDDSSDRIGSVDHTFFLTSDAFLQGRGEWPHVSLLSGEDLRATDARYESGAFWEHVNHAFIAVPNDGLYYLKQGGSAQALQLIRRRNGAEEIVFSMDAGWGGNLDIWGDGVLSGLSRLGDGLFFNDSRHMYRFDLNTGSTETAYDAKSWEILCGSYIRSLPSGDFVELELAPEGEQRCIRLTTVETLFPIRAGRRPL